MPNVLVISRVYQASSFAKTSPWLSEMGEDAKIAVPALVAIYFDDVDVVLAVAMGVL